MCVRMCLRVWVVVNGFDFLSFSSTLLISYTTTNTHR